MENGKLIYALSEERITREKNAGGFPHHALNRLLNDNNLSVSEISCVSMSGRSAIRSEWTEREKILERYRKQCVRPTTFVEKAMATVYRLRNHVTFHSKFPTANVLNEDRLTPLKNLGITEDKTLLFDHHSCHAAAAFFSAPRFGDDTLVLTNDGGGDGLCATVSHSEGVTLHRVAEIGQSESFASLYSRTTFLLGMVPLEHEYKIMGMAPYGYGEKATQLADQILSLFNWEEDHLKWRRSAGLAPTYQWGPMLEEMFRFRRFDTICAALQLVVEEMALNWVRAWLSRTGAKKLVLGGGLFMNVKLNKQILQLPQVHDLFVMPSCSDESNSIGAAYNGFVAIGLNPSSISPLDTLYLGAHYTDSDVRDALSQFRFTSRVDIEEPRDIEDTVATLLAKGEVVARYAGREEFGARALGNRSILCDPSNVSNITKINKLIKKRDFWMPFAASMLEEQAENNLIRADKYRSEFMMMTFDTTDTKSSFAAAVHPYDNTIRPQIVTRSANPNYFKIIQRFQEKSCHNGGVLNTSFNLHGFPIASSPLDALRVFDKSGIRALALESFVIYKDLGT